MANPNPSIQQYEPFRIPKNWSAEEKKFIQQLTDTMDDIYKRFGRLSFSDFGTTLKSRITDSEEILLEVSEERIFHAATEAALLVNLAAMDPVVAMAAELLWYDTTNNLFKRCTSVGPPIVWKTLQTDELRNASITIDSSGITLLSSGNLVATALGILKLLGGSTNATAIAIRNDTDYFISAGHLTQSDAPFSVTKAGVLKATSGTFGGVLDAVTGTFEHIKLDDPSETYYEIDLGEFDLTVEGSSVTLSGITFGSSQLNYIGATSSGALVMRGNSGLNFYCPTGSILDFSVGSGGAQMYMNNYRMDLTGDLDVFGDIEATSYSDRTPAYDGDALSELSMVKDDGKGNIDHTSLPKAAQKKVRGKKKINGKNVETEEDGRDLGMMISILTKAVQQLTDIVNKQQEQLDKLIAEKDTGKPGNEKHIAE